MIKKLITLFLFGILYLPGVEQTPGAALHFDGADDIVNVPANAAFDFTTGTAECWFNSAASSGNRCVLAMRTNTSGARWSIHVNESSNEVGFFNGAAFTALPVTINPGTWYHLAVVMNSTSAIIYLNGVNIGTIALGIQTGATGLPVTIGGHTDAAKCASGTAHCAHRKLPVACREKRPRSAMDLSQIIISTTVTTVQTMPESPRLPMQAATTATAHFRTLCSMEPYPTGSHRAE
jgi:hypothetical protein